MTAMEMHVTSASASLSLALDVKPGLEVKGTAGWLTPHRVKWTVHGFVDHRGNPSVYARAVVEGPRRSGRWGGAWMCDSGDAPGWLPVPEEWLADAEQIVTEALSHHPTEGNEHDRYRRGPRGAGLPHGIYGRTPW